MIRGGSSWTGAALALATLSLVPGTADARGPKRSSPLAAEAPLPIRA
jgi:hypothetical protein